MRKQALVAFYEAQIARAKREGLLFSLHLKATMMKVSDPIIFGHAVRVFFKDVLTKHAAAFAQLGVDLNNGFGDLVEKIQTLPAAEQGGDRGRHQGGLRGRPRPLVRQLRQRHHQPARPERRDRRRLDAGDDPRRRQGVRRPGQARRHAGAHPRQQLRRRVPGDASSSASSTARFDPRDDGLGAERRAHGAGRRRVRLAQQDVRDPAARAGPRRPTSAGKVLLEHDVDAGDIWRACQTKDAPVQDWVKLAVNRARLEPARRPCSGSTRSAPTTRRSSPR